MRKKARRRPRGRAATSQNQRRKVEAKLVAELFGTTADQVTVSLVETPTTSKAKGGMLFSEMAGR